MIGNWINNQIKKHKEEVARYKKQKEQYQKHLEQRKLDQVQKQKDELIDLRLITIKNVSYIKSYLNVLNSNIKTSKGNNAAETKRKREWIRNKINWLENKLVEEEGMVTYYDSVLSSY